MEKGARTGTSSLILGCLLYYVGGLVALIALAFATMTFASRFPEGSPAWRSAFFAWLVSARRTALLLWSGIALLALGAGLWLRGLGFRPLRRRTFSMGRLLASVGAAALLFSSLRYPAAWIVAAYVLVFIPLVWTTLSGFGAVLRAPACRVPGATCLPHTRRGE